MLFTPDRHEPLGEHRFDEAAAREAIVRIAARAEAELGRADGRWPLEPADALSDGDGPASGLYCGAGLCHGTAGNAYGLLALWQRAGDDRWLERARTG